MPDKDAIREAAEAIRGCIGPNMYYEGPRGFERAEIEDSFIEDVIPIIRAVVERETRWMRDELEILKACTIVRIDRIRQGGES